ncbi:lipoprotein signal peptidase [Owenweeksia hongkongensis]|uniref:lipoprotein signal peptidase n=1 Tax=Owenweeksia hongkongensis TaxID=253245 RepID=UPI003A937858
MKRAALIVSLVLLVDQISKIWIKTNMFLGQEYKITDWFIIHFTENPGMAFGMELGGDYGKLILTLFRIVVVGGIFYWLRGMIKENAKPVAITAVSLVLAGAIGNIIDSVFYGVFFNESYGELATFMPAEGGYAGWFHGRVVDMLYFPLFRGYLPDWIPFWGGDYFVFFRPIFNIADTAISFGVGLLLVFQKHIFKK